MNFIEPKNKLNQYNLIEVGSFQRGNEKNALIYRRDSYKLTKPDGVARMEFAINHNLGYEPLVFVQSSKDKITYKILPERSSLGAGLELYLGYEVDKIRLLLIVSMVDIAMGSPTPEYTEYFSYLILRDKNN